MKIVLYDYRLRMCLGGNLVIRCIENKDGFTYKTVIVLSTFFPLPCTLASSFVYHYVLLPSSLTLHSIILVPHSITLLPHSIILLPHLISHSAASLIALLGASFAYHHRGTFSLYSHVCRNYRVCCQFFQGWILRFT